MPDTPGWRRTGTHGNNVSFEYGTMPDTLTPASEKLLRDFDKYPDAIDYSELSARLWMIEREHRAHIDALTAAVQNLPRWSMVGEMNTRHMEAESNGHYFDAAAVLAILRGES